MGKDLNGKELGDGISQRKDGTYHARYVNRFGVRKSLYSRNKKEIKDTLNKCIYEDKHQLSLLDDTLTLADWYKKWMEIHKYKVIRENTKQYYNHVYKKHISPTLGKMRLTEITQLQIKDLIKNLDKKGYKYETQNKVRILILDMFEKAMIDGYANRNPAKGIVIKRNEEKKITVLSIEEQSIFFDCCKGTFYDNLFVVAVNTGLRPGELCAIRWQDIDFKEMEMSITRTLIYQKWEGDEKKVFKTGPPKTKSSIRRIPINKQCEIALKKQKLQYNVVMGRMSAKPLPGFEDLLFTTKYGTPINSEIYSGAIKAIIDQINLCRDNLEQMEYFSGHCFRHTFATRCFESGIQPKTVQMYLGHASLKMTMDLYTHVLDEHKREEMLKLDRTMETVQNSSDAIVEEKFQSKFN